MLPCQNIVDINKVGWFALKIGSRKIKKTKIFGDLFKMSFYNIYCKNQIFFI